ncbi:MAG: prolyl oligopeptidase family serine peptidase [Candidatus Celaenobacter polaris]|nr:prolyl oligopeptidase family serine peptidase [Candidatus Celaenobacter polaris]
MRFIILISSLLLINSCNSNPVDNVSYDPPGDANYQHEEVEIKLDNGDVLAGSLTYPANTDKWNPIAILITGSSPHDRDNSKPSNPISAYRPFRQISHVLSSNGIAVLRIDDRGIGKSKGGNISKMTTKERARDIEQCISYVKLRPEFDSARICLIGLSEGASIAHLIASKDKSIKIIVLLSGIGTKGSEILEYQVKNGLYSERDLTKILRRDRNMQFLFDFDPVETIRLVQQPVLIIHGKADRRVPSTDAYILAEELRKSGNQNVTVHVLPDHNHALLKEDSLGIPSSYGRISSNSIPDDVINLILNFIQEEI